MNRELLLQVKEQILREPKQFFMSGVLSGQYDDDEEASDVCDEIPNCNTAACIAGWTVVIARGVTPKELLGDNHGIFMRIEQEAAKLLRITTSHKLFQAENWPEPYKTRWCLSPPKDAGAEDRAEIAADVIDLAITGTLDLGGY